jgi:hypothetical protein
MPKKVGKVNRMRRENINKVNCSSHSGGTIKHEMPKAFFCRLFAKIDYVYSVVVVHTFSICINLNLKKFEIAFDVKLLSF